MSKENGIAVDSLPTTPQAEIEKLTYDRKKDTINATIPAAFMEIIQKAVPFYQQAMVGMQGELERISQQEQLARSRHPVFAAIQQIGAHLGNQPDMPSFTRGMAQASMSMNPDPDRLAAQKLPLYAQIAEMAGKQSAAATNAAEVQLRGMALLDSQHQTDIYRQGQADAARQNAYSKAVATLNGMMGEKELTAAQVRSVLPKADDAVVESFIQQSKVVKANRDQENEDKKLESRGKRTMIAAQEDAYRASAESRRANAKYTEARAKMLPFLTQARVNELDQRALYHVNRGNLDWAGVALRSKELEQSIERWKTSSGLRKIEVYNEIAANLLAPQSIKEQLYGELSKLGLASNVKPPTIDPLETEVPVTTVVPGGGYDGTAPAGPYPAPANGPRPSPTPVPNANAMAPTPIDVPPAVRKQLKEGQPMTFANGKTLVMRGSVVYDVTGMTRQ